MHLLSPKTILFHGITRWFDSSIFVIPHTLANVAPAQSPSRGQFPGHLFMCHWFSLPSSIPVNHLPCSSIAGLECVFFFLLQCNLIFLGVPPFTDSCSKLLRAWECDELNGNCTWGLSWQAWLWGSLLLVLVLHSMALELIIFAMASWANQVDNAKVLGVVAATA